MFSILAIYNNETLPNSKHYFAKVGSKFCPKLNKPSKNCQSGKILLNLVTLVVSHVVRVTCHHHHHSFVHFHAEKNDGKRDHGCESGSTIKSKSNLLLDGGSE